MLNWGQSKQFKQAVSVDITVSKLSWRVMCLSCPPNLLGDMKGGK
jgi:hypothetical protein